MTAYCPLGKRADQGCTANTGKCRGGSVGLDAEPASNATVRPSRSAPRKLAAPAPAFAGPSSPPWGSRNRGQREGTLALAVLPTDAGKSAIYRPVYYCFVEPQLRERLQLAQERERSSQQGMGRNPKAARNWRVRRKAVEDELARRHGDQ
ncbi:MAG: hypothetical protein LC799_27255 [Actinobacteria bacterium]|nr:hypothetical protein [Actinomycetota bacterium]